MNQPNFIIVMNNNGLGCFEFAPDLSDSLSLTIVVSRQLKGVKNAVIVLHARQ